MQEELEEGHFDKEGMYHWKKEDNIQDNWLENIDWCKVIRHLVKNFLTTRILLYNLIFIVCLD